MLRIDKIPFEIDNPEVGDIRLRLTPKGQPYKQIYYPCDNCGKPRWARMIHGKTEGLFCDKCNRVRMCTDEKRNLNVSIAQLNNWQKPEVRQNHLIAGKKPEVIEKRRVSALSTFARTPDGTGMKLGLKSRWNSPNARGKQSKVQKQLWSNPEFKNKQMDKMVKGSANAKPNEPETIILKILNTYFTDEWDYVGNGSRRIGDLKPDFVNKTHKWIIEHFGDYIHTKRVRRYTDTEIGRMEYFSKYGYKMLVFWEHEIYSLPTIDIVDKIASYFGTSPS